MAKMTIQGELFQAEVEPEVITKPAAQLKEMRSGHR